MDGVMTSGHWAPSLDNDANKKFLAEFKQGTGKDGDLDSIMAMTRWKSSRWVSRRPRAA